MLGGFHDGAVRLHVADRHRLLLGVRGQELDVTEPAGERHLLRLGEVLAGEDQDCVLEKGRSTALQVGSSMWASSRPVTTAPSVALVGVTVGVMTSSWVGSMRRPRHPVKS